jgi:hypothetical protein
METLVNLLPISWTLPSSFQLCASCFESFHWVYHPKFHVVFDDWFATVSSDPPASLPDFNSDEWNRMFGDTSFQYMLDDDD